MHLLAINIDGQRFGDHHVISGVGADRAGDKRVLGIEIGAIEKAAPLRSGWSACANADSEPISNTCS